MIVLGLNERFFQDESWGYEVRNTFHRFKNFDRLITTYANGHKIITRYYDGYKTITLQ